MRLASLLVAFAVVVGWTAATAHEPDEHGKHPAALERDTRYGPVVGSDDSATSGTYSWKGIPFAKPPVGRTALEGAGRAGAVARATCGA